MYTESPELPNIQPLKLQLDVLQHILYKSQENCAGRRDESLEVIRKSDPGRRDYSARSCTRIPRFRHPPVSVFGDPSSHFYSVHAQTFQFSGMPHALWVSAVKAVGKCPKTE